MRGTRKSRLVLRHRALGLGFCVALAMLLTGVARSAIGFRGDFEIGPANGGWQQWDGLQYESDRPLERKRDTGERMDALVRGADWAPMGTSGTEAVDPVADAANEKAPFPGLS